MSTSAKLLPINSMSYLALILPLYILGILIYILYRSNPEIFILNKEVFIFIHEAFNAIVLLTIPFIFGIISASARVLISDLRIFTNIKLILASGLMSSFSWLGIKSKVFIALISPYLAQNIPSSEKTISDGSSEFYSMILVAVIVGAFASNLYIFINQKIEILTKNNPTENNDLKNS
ncbi:hypothetical protein CTTA_3462 [Comamonas testosteroni]|uniref:Uncharacterized protein n=1 Tax=Comamonas testosteroni TaxID=285 RepID=A0A5A7MF64_COMTE|nr:hypothetical protein [Comamonas testosteroni]GEQ76457.1 hypothetical protein CTTA_3462 [Comamonas testosteroni]